MSFRKAAQVGLLLVAAGCAGSGAPSGDSSDAPANRVPEPTLVAEFGCLGCEGPELLAPARVRVTDFGRVLVLDQFPPFVRGFEPEAGLALTAVQQGEGPGEISTPAGLHVTGDGGFLVHALMAGGVGLQRFSPDGEHRSSVTLPLRSPTSAAYDPGRELLYVISFLPMPGADWSQSARLDRIGPDGESTTLLEREELPESLPLDEQLPAGSQSTYPLAVIEGGGFALGEAWNYVIRLYDQDGQPTGTLERELARPARSQESLEEERARFEKWAERSGNPVPEIPDDWPHFDRFGLDSDLAGGLWVRTHRGGPGTTVFDVFHDGDYLGEVTVEADMPTDYASFDVHGDWLAGVHATEEGDRVRLWRLDDG